MSEFVINSAEKLSEAIGLLRETWSKHKYVRMVLRAKRRSLDQNDISHVWYEQIVAELREDDALGVKCYCKLHHGIPILRAEDAEFREFYDRAIKGLTYEQKLTAMKYLPVTSLMSVDQGSRYLVAVQDDYRNRGVTLEFPEKAK